MNQNPRKCNKMGEMWQVAHRKKQYCRTMQNFDQMQQVKSLLLQCNETH